MDYRRSDRVAELLLEFISQLLREGINDPRVEGVTLTTAEVSRDLRHAKIYFTLLSETKERAEVLAGLKSTSGFIRSRIGKELRLRFVPSLEFTYDQSPDQAQRIDDLLRQVKGER